MKKLISLMLAMVLCLTPVLVSCGGNNTPTPTPPDPDGPDDPGTGGGSRTGIFMQGYGDEEQHKEFNSMVEGFNNSEYARQYGLFLTLDWLGQTTYEQGIESGSTVSPDNRVDIMFVNDRKFKLWATNGYMDDLSAYTSTSEYREEKLGNMWSSIYPRFRYNSNGNTSYEDDTLWGVPVDTSPTAIYYNRQAMENCGVIVISVDDDVVTQDNFAQFQGEYEGLTNDMIGEHLMDLWNENKIADKFGQWHDTCGNRGGVDSNGNPDGGGYEADVLVTREITVPAKGYYREDSYNNYVKADGYAWVNPNAGGVTSVVKVFNASIAMNWDEIEDLAQLLTLTKNRNNHNRRTTRGDVATTYGYYTEWWFNYGWSVGGDCLQDLTGEGTWTYGLTDWSTNYKVTAAGDGYVGKNTGTVYHEGDTIEFIDKLDVVAYGPEYDETGAMVVDDEGNIVFNDGDLLLPNQQGGFEVYNETTQGTTPLGSNPDQLYTYDSEIRDEIKNNATDDMSDTEAMFLELPSTKDAVNRYLQCIQLGVMPLPSSFGGNSSTIAEFGNGNIAMVVELGYQIGLVRALTGSYEIEWGVAPLPQYKEYVSPSTDDTTVKVQGVEGGHSEATALSIAKASKNKQNAWYVIDWLTSDYMTVNGEQEPAGQYYKAVAGYIPNQPTIANSSTFIKEDEKTLNLDIFFDVLEFEEAGDWWYLPDNAWISIWAGPLNEQVRNGQMTPEQWFNNYCLQCTQELIDYSYFFGSDAFQNIFSSHFN